MENLAPGSPMEHSVIKVLYFARIKEALGQAEESFSSDKITNVESLINSLSKRGNLWQQTLVEEKVLIAVNQEICGLNQNLKSGDEVAFFPPVTGG